MNTFAKKARFGTLVIFIIANFFVWNALLAEERGGELKVAFLDVGQGDAIFIEAPSGNQMLVDGGPSKKVLAELNKIMPVYDRTIDIIVATHPDKDHIAGLVDVLSRYQINFVLMTEAVSESATFAAFEKAVEQNGAQVIRPRRGMIINLGDGAGFKIIFPDRDMAGQTDVNEGSIVGKVEYGQTAALLTGDSPISIERYLVLLGGANLQSDILKVGHHGSRTSSSAEFLAAVAPTLAVISVSAKNSYGHPHQEVLASLQNLGAQIFRTDELGTIIFTSDGQSFQRE
ncbi:MAG: ComEC/Rec2 family competence protein [Candidatus Paceibacterota bacterium]|jgi:competence protein ComEC